MSTGVDKERGKFTKLTSLLNFNQIKNKIAFFYLILRFVLKKTLL